MLKALWARYSFRTFTPRIARHRYGKYEFRLQVVDFDGASWYDLDSKHSGCAEIDIHKAHKATAGARVVNAGANHGLPAMMMAKDVGCNGLVWAIEPNNQ